MQIHNNMICKSIQLANRYFFTVSNLVNLVNLTSDLSYYEIIRTKEKHYIIIIAMKNIIGGIDTF